MTSSDMKPMKPMNSNTTQDLVGYYDEHKNKPFDEWLVFDSVFSASKQGKQGLVGILKSICGRYKYVFKISQYINHLAQHETAVMSGLNDISPYCLHFCKVIGIITTDVDPSCRKRGNPFDKKCKRRIKKDVILCEYIEKSSKFYTYIRAEDKISEKVLYSTIKQVLLATAMAQKEKQFSHYDLHSYNILMKKCNPNSVFLYVLDDENQFAVPTRGHYPVIIDFGFSYISDMADGPMWPSMGHTLVGFMSDRFDWVADPKLFLVTVSDEIINSRETKKSRILRRIVKNLFYPLSIDWESGWDTVDKKSASDKITGMLDKHNPGSDFFRDYEHYCIDLIQTMIILPLEKQDYSGMYKAYSVFLKEWLHIENQISSPFYNLCILKHIVDMARYVRPAYVMEETRDGAVRAFKHSIHDTVKEIAKFCKLTNIHFERMLCSLIVYTKCLEGMLYEIIGKRMVEKEREYAKLPLKNIEQIYAGIEVNLPDDFVYTKDTVVYVFDSIAKGTTEMTLSTDQIDFVNSVNPLCRGTALYDMYKAD